MKDARARDIQKAACCRSEAAEAERLCNEETALIWRQSVRQYEQALEVLIIFSRSSARLGSCRLKEGKLKMKLNVKFEV